MSEKRIVVRVHGVGNGRLECDGKDHWQVVEDHVVLNCLPETHAGPCRSPEGCKELAAELAAASKPKES